MRRLKTGIFKVKDILRIFVLVVCGAVLGMNLYHANASRLVGNQMPMPFGYGSAVVLSGSMEPAMSEGDLILVSEHRAYEEGSVVVFQDGRNLVVHRIVEMNESAITTKGDANNASDHPMDCSAVKGTVIAVLPGVGHLVNFIKTPAGTIFFVAAAVILIELPYRRERRKDDEERQRIIDEIRRLKDEQ